MHFQLKIPENGRKIIIIIQANSKQKSADVFRC